MGREHPDTFKIPGRYQRQHVHRGFFVKLVFELPEPSPEGYAAERMWVRVTSRSGKRYIGELSNDPQMVDGLSRGEDVEFGPQHILEISKTGEPEARALHAIISLRVVEGHRPGRLYRDEPVHPVDSGWQILAGDEDDSYLENTDNLITIPLEALLDGHPELKDLLDAPINTEWVRDVEASTWRRNDNSEQD